MKTKKEKSEASKQFEFIEREILFSAACNHQKYLATNDAGELRQYKFKNTYRPRFLPDKLDYVNSISDNRQVKDAIDVLEPLKNHLRGTKLFGLVKTPETKALPYIAPDLDRHNEEDPAEFLNLCEVTHDELSKLKDFHFFLQVNRENGSAKFFTFHMGLKQIPISMATDTADAIQERVFEKSGKEIEVFGSSKNHLCLHPLHPDKSFLTDAGRIGTEKCFYMGMKYRINDCWYTKEELDEMAANTRSRFAFRESLNISEIKKKRIYYNRHSISEFYKAYNRKYSVSKADSLYEIRKYASMSNKSEASIIVPKSFIKKPKASVASIAKPAPKLARKRSKVVQTEIKLTARQTETIEALQIEPDARRRQHRGCLILANVLKRPPTEVEATEFIREQNLYSGSWNNSKRAARIRGIVNFIAKSFDPKKCGSGKPFDFNFNSAKWANWIDIFASSKLKDIDFNTKHISYQTPRINPETLEVIGVGKEYGRNYNVKGIAEAALYTFFIDECFHTSKEGDGGGPEARIGAAFNRCRIEGFHNFVFNVHKLRRIIAILNQLEIIDCDYIKYPGKSYCYSEGVNYPFGRRLKKKAVASSQRLAKQREFNSRFLKAKPLRNAFTSKAGKQVVSFSLRDSFSAMPLIAVANDCYSAPASSPLLYIHNTESVGTQEKVRFEASEELNQTKGKPPD